VRRRRAEHSPRIWKTSEVFVAGDRPTVTYNPRDDLHLEEEVKAYRSQGGKALSVAGPSKSGKTVLIERLFPKTSAIWVEGGDLASIDYFWERVADGLEAWDELTLSDEEEGARSDEVELEVGVPLVRGSDRESWSSTRRRGVGRSRRRPLPDLVREELDRQAWPIVIDDFQYVPPAVRRAIARAIKTLITRTRVVLIAVPHQAFEPVRAEPDMDGRVWQLEVERWSTYA
jgi:hypothetical protein